MKRYDDDDYGTGCALATGLFCMWAVFFTACGVRGFIDFLHWLF